MRGVGKREGEVYHRERAGWVLQRSRRGGLTVGMGRLLDFSPGGFEARIVRVHNSLLSMPLSSGAFNILFFVRPSRLYLPWVIPFRSSPRYAAYWLRTTEC